MIFGDVKKKGIAKNLIELKENNKNTQNFKHTLKVQKYVSTFKVQNV